MNFLGHLVLSGDNEDILYGNFIGDSIKGKSYNNFNEPIKKGILLHRFIDHFTDHHPAYLNGKRRMYEKLPKVSGIVLDILYDHILWLNWDAYFSIDTDKFINSCYEILDSRVDQMPKRVSLMYWYMKKDNWLYNYQFEWGIYKALSDLEKRITPSIDIDKVKSIFNNHRSQYISEFDDFFCEIMIKSKEFLDKK